MTYDNILPHLSMLRDSVRTDAYRRAIAEVVRPGDRVLDFGSGTGVLSVFAERAGASRVYALDRSPMLNAAKQIFSDNDCKNVEVIFGEGDTIELPTEVDVIVSEWMGHFLFAEQMLEPLLRLRDRFLRKGGRIIPDRCSLHAGLVTAASHFDELTFLRTRPYGIDFGAVERWPFCEIGVVRFQHDEILGDTASLGEIELTTLPRMPLKWSGRITSRDPGVVFGVCGWFDAQLSPGVRLSTSPLEPPTHWWHFFFPFDRPLELSAGETVDIEVKIVPLGMQNGYEWRAVTPRETREGDNMVHQAWLSRTR
jgi:type I protein arginine methyltransferase